MLRVTRVLTGGCIEFFSIWWPGAVISRRPEFDCARHSTSRSGVSNIRPVGAELAQQRLQPGILDFRKHAGGHRFWTFNILDLWLLIKTSPTAIHTTLQWKSNRQTIKLRYRKVFIYYLLYYYLFISILMHLSCFEDGNLLRVADLLIKTTLSKGDCEFVVSLLHMVTIIMPKDPSTVFKVDGVALKGHTSVSQELVSHFCDFYDLFAFSLVFTFTRWFVRLRHQKILDLCNRRSWFGFKYAPTTLTLHTVKKKKCLNVPSGLVRDGAFICEDIWVKQVVPQSWSDVSMQQRQRMPEALKICSICHAEYEKKSVIILCDNVTSLNCTYDH